jgi:FkbM family methyltransferase
MRIPLPVSAKNLIRKLLLPRLIGDRQFVDQVFCVDHTYELIKRNHIEVKTAVDIGANTGQWVQGFWQHFPRARVLSIEANPENISTLRAFNPDCIQACLAETAGLVRTFYLPNPAVERVNTGASLYKEVLPGYDDPICLRLQTSTLDGLNRRFDLVKLDVQGAELDVLRGGRETLRNAKLVMVEISLSRYNHTAPLGAEVISYLHEQGFFLLAINEVLFHRHHPIQLDCCFAHSSLSGLAALDA